LDRELNRGREPLLRWLDLPRTDGESDLMMAPVPTIGDEEGGEVSSYLKRLTSRRAANEQVRLLYVAATRAKQTLGSLASPQPKPDGTIVRRSGTLLACLWPAVEQMAVKDVRPDGAAVRGASDASPAAASDTSLATVSDAASGPPAKPLRRIISTWSLPD